jgi:hypothetical protein
VRYYNCGSSWSASNVIIFTNDYYCCQFPKATFTAAACLSCYLLFTYLLKPRRLQRCHRTWWAKIKTNKKRQEAVEKM